VSVYGPDLPVWALLASGSTGGVRRASLPTHRLYCVKSYHRSPTGSLRILWVSQLWLFFLQAHPTPCPSRRRQVACATPHGPPKRHTGAVHRERIESRRHRIRSVSICHPRFFIHASSTCVLPELACFAACHPVVSSSSPFILRLHG
jgi:hypothetical protein